MLWLSPCHLRPKQQGNQKEQTCTVGDTVQSNDSHVMKFWVKKTHYIERFDDVRIQLCAFVIILSTSPCISQRQRVTTGNQQHIEYRKWLVNT